MLTKIIFPLITSKTLAAAFSNNRDAVAIRNLRTVGKDEASLPIPPDKTRKALAFIQSRGLIIAVAYKRAVSYAVSAGPDKILIAIAGLRLIVAYTVGDQTAVDSTFLASPIVVLHALASVDPNVPNNGMLVQSAVSNTSRAIPVVPRETLAFRWRNVDSFTPVD